jgi:hypothetical protein
LRKITRKWPDVISNTDLWTATNQKPIQLQIKERKWKYTGHTLRSEKSIAREALRWKPQGKRKAGRPRNTWRRTILNEVKEKVWSWDDLRRVANNRVRWRSAVDALCS